MDVPVDLLNELLVDVLLEVEVFVPELQLQDLPLPDVIVWQLELSGAAEAS